MSGRNVTPLVARPRTQNERILELLADGNWHTTRAILQHVPCIVHSRIAEINKRASRDSLGYVIEHRGAGGGATNHEYRLAGTPGEQASETDTLTARTSDSACSPDAPSTARPAGVQEAEASATFEQLRLVAA